MTAITRMDFESEDGSLTAVIVRVVDRRRLLGVSWRLSTYQLDETILKEQHVANRREAEARARAWCEG